VTRQRVVSATVIRFSLTGSARPGVVRKSVGNFVPEPDASSNGKPSQVAISVGAGVHARVPFDVIGRRVAAGCRRWCGDLYPLA
jgi:hypothetical protein